ncbi:MAG: hypothetical protein VX346_21935 [Planctomycetota bacterium]|nr:hypothetical protein [Planctomycetota bacterium]
MNNRISTALALLCLASHSTAAELGPALTSEKKLIAFAASLHAASPAYLRRHVADMERRLPLEGLIICVYHDHWEAEASKRKKARGSGLKTGQEGMFFGGRSFTRDDFRQDVRDLKATSFRKFTDNFILLTTSEQGSQWTGNEAHRNLDWFDPKWSTIAENGAVAAQVAREAGFKGLFIDAEQYAGSRGLWRRPFDYRARPDRGERTLSEVSLQVRKRGREWMQAVTAVYPEITIILYPNTGWKSTLEYELLGPFADGLLEGLGPQATLVDSGVGYHLQTYQQFMDLRTKTQKQGLEKTQVPHLYKQVKQGFGLWLDYESRTGGPFAGWNTDPKNYHKNYRPPEELGNTLHNALNVSDRYVWLFVWHGAAWWAPGARNVKSCPLCPHPQGVFQHAYAEAIANRRQPHPLDWTPARVEKILTPEDLVAIGNNILDNADLESWGVPNRSPPGWVLGGQGPVVARDNKNTKTGGTYSAKLSTLLARGHVFLDQRLAATPYTGRTITLGAWVKDEYRNGHVQILDFVGDSHESSSVTSEWTDDTGWRFLTATKTIRPDARLIVFRLGVGAVKGVPVMFDGSMAVVVE